MQIKALGNMYPLPSKPLELGEQRLLKREFGWIPGNELDWNDPDHISALLFMAMREQDRDAPAKALLQSINRVKTIELLNDDGTPLDVSDEDTDDEARPAGDPTPAVDDTADEAGS